MIKEQEMLEKELKENFDKDIDTIRNHITSLRLIGVGLSNTLKEKDKEIERLNNIINKVKVDINNMKEIIRQQPSEDSDTDEWIINRLNGLLYIIKGSESNE